MAATKDGSGSGSRSKRSVQEQEHAVIRQQLRNAIRKVWSRYSPERKRVLWEAKKTLRRYTKDGSISKVPMIVYTCAECGEDVSEKQREVDHIDPVGPTPEFPPSKDSTGWANWLLRVFCAVENLRVLCKICHLKKSATEKHRATRTASDGDKALAPSGGEDESSG